MSTWSGGGKKKPRGGKGWEKKQSLPKQSAPAWREGSAGGPRARSRRWDKQWGIYAVLTACLVGVFLYALLRSPKKTPVLLVTGSGYASPAPPNVWAREDADALKSSDMTMLDVREVFEQSWEGTDSPAEREFREHLKELGSPGGGFRKPREPLIVFINMPGVVDEAGEPHLLPPDASPLVSDDWLAVDWLLKQLADPAVVPAERPKLLVLAGSPPLINWEMGIEYNTYVERVKQKVEADRTPNLAVLTSADAGQVSWTSAALRGSAFARFFRLGVAGAADGATGEKDRKVTLRELHTYLKQEVGQWVTSTRGVNQSPVLVSPAEEIDFVVSRALSDSRLSELRRELSNSEPPSPSVSSAKIGELWSSIERLREAGAIRFDPLSLAQFERRLLRLEKLAYGGAGLNEDAQNARKSLEAELASATSKINKRGESISSHWRVTSPVVEVDFQDLCDPALQAYFDPESLGSEAYDGLIDNLAKPVTGSRAAPEIAPGLIASAMDLEVTHFVSAAQQHRATGPRQGMAGLRALIDLRRRADRLATPIQEGAPGDEQAHYYARPVVKQGDRQRRLAEDALFISSPPEEWSGLADDAKDHFRSAELVEQRVADSIANYQRVMAESPYLVCWRLQNDIFGTEQDSGKDRVDIAEHLRNAYLLAADIGGLVRLGDDAEQLKQTAQNFKDRAQNLLSSHNTLLGELESVSGKIDNSTKRPADLLAIEWVLKSPLTKSDQRVKLLTVRQSLDKSLHANYFQSSESKEPGPTKSTAELVARWGASPLMAILDPTRSPDSAPASGPQLLTWFEKHNAEARDAILNHSNWYVHGAEGDSPSWIDDRNALAAAARRARVAAPILSGSPQADPVARLRMFDLAELLLWHAERSMDGFWHTVIDRNPKTLSDLLEPPSVTNPVQQTHFLSAAKRLLDSAERCRLSESEPEPLGLAAQIQQVRDTLQRRLDASDKGLAINAGKSEPERNSSGAHNVTIWIGDQQTSRGLPLGRPAVFLSERLPERFPILPGSPDPGWFDAPFEGSDSVERTLRVADVEGPSVTAVIFFRGRQAFRRIDVQAVDEAAVQYEWPSYDSQSVTLKGDQPAPPSLVFILDCSGSMSKRVNAVDGSSSTRMDQAKVALSSMFDLMRLPRRSEKYKVGVFFFGHRVGYKAVPGGGPHRPETNREYVRKFEPERGWREIPELDVEEVLDLGTFDAYAHNLVNQHLGLVSQRGVTPVYLSITRALDVLGKDDNPTQSVIVITDGANDQTGYAGVTKTSAKNVLDKWRSVGRDIPIFIIGFGIEEAEARTDANLRQGIAEFKEITKTTNGDWLATNSSADLLRELKKRLTLNGYTVRTTGDQLLTKDPNTDEELKRELNLPVDVPKEEVELPAELVVEFQGSEENVTVEGGEALQFRVDGGRFSYIPFNQQATERALVRGPGGLDSGNLLRIHPPKRYGRLVQFRFSVQNTESHFTPRPKTIWVEATAEGSDQTYWFYDPVYQPNLPVPLIEFPATNWPEGVDRARVRFWCTDPEAARPVKPLRTFRLSDVLKNLQGKEAYETNLELGDAEIALSISIKTDEADRFRVQVDETHTGGARSLGSVRVAIRMEDQEVHPMAVSHSFLALHNYAKHQFDYARENLTTTAFAGKATVEIYSGASLKEQCLTLEEQRGVVVRVVDSGVSRPPTVLGDDSP